MKNSLKFRRQHGSILVAVYLVVTGLSIASIAYFARSNAFLQSAERNQNRLIAFNMAETAIDVALTQLTADKTYSGTNGYVAFNTTTAPGGYSSRVTTPVSNPNIRLIQATGFAPDNNAQSRAAQRANIVVYAEVIQNPLFDFAIFAEDTISLTSSGSVASVDSYNSTTGAYNAATARDNGDIAANAINLSTISLVGNTLVKGDAFVGPGGDPNTGISISPNSSITGTKSALPEPKIYPTPTTTLPVSGAINLSGKNTQTLMPGTYHFSSISISGQALLNISGPVTIYVDGAVDISGQGIATAGNLPTNFLLYVIGTDTVKINGQGALYAGVYAPNAPVDNVGNAGFFGAAISENYHQTGNSAIHFDEALMQVQSSINGRMRLKSWQELNTLTWGT